MGKYLTVLRPETTCVLTGIYSVFHYYMSCLKYYDNNPALSAC